MGAIKVAIAEDQELIRESLEMILNFQTRIHVVLKAKDGQELLNHMKSTKPDVILMDVRMPRLDGVECTRVIRKNNPDVKIIILTAFEDDEYVYNAIKYGANGYILKGISPKELVDSINIVHSGGALISANAAVKLFNYFSHLANGNLNIDTKSYLDFDFNENELRIIQLIGMGFSNKEIAYKMNFSEGTCRNYTSEILCKTGLRDRTQIAIFAIQSGLTYKLMKEDH